MALFGGMIYNRKSARKIPTGGATLILGFTPKMAAAKGQWAVAGQYPTFRGPTRKYNAPELTITGTVWENVNAKGRGVTPINWAADILSQSFNYDGQTWLSGKRMQPQGLAVGGRDYWTLPLDLSSSFAPNTAGNTWTWFEEHCILDVLWNASGFASYYSWNTGLQGSLRVVSLAAHSATPTGVLFIAPPDISARWTDTTFSVLCSATSDFYQTLNGSYGVAPRAGNLKRVVYVQQYTGGPGASFNSWLYVKSNTGITSVVMLGTKTATDRSGKVWDKSFYADPCFRIGEAGGSDLNGGRTMGAFGLLSGALSSGARDAIATAILNNATW